MEKLILEYLNEEFYYSSVDNAIYSTLNEYQKIGYIQLENIITKIFNINEDLAHFIVHGWLLSMGVELIKRNWDRRYLAYNKTGEVFSEPTITENVDFEYKLILNEE
jgi:hypothetical protein